MIEVIGSLFDADTKYIAHQCNVVTNRAAHLAKDMFTKFPYADVYSSRTENDKPGTISIRGNGLDQRFIIAMFAQYYPGAPRNKDSTLDGTKVREQYFKRCLFGISKIPDLKSIAFPFQIGCGAAAGLWFNYAQMLSNFANYVEKQQGTIVKIYKLPGV